MSNALPYVELGVEPHGYDLYLGLYKDTLASSPSDEGAIAHRKLDLATFAMHVTESAYIRGEWKVCREWSQRAAVHTAAYLLGAWQSGEEAESGSPQVFHAPQDWHPTYWEYLFIPGLAWSAVGDHWLEVDHLLEFPTERTKPDEDTGRVGLAYYRGLARWWRNRSDCGWFSELKQLRGARSRGYHLLCDAIAGIAGRDAAATAEAIHQYVDWFVKGRDHDEQFPLSATFVWNVARRDGLSLLLPPEIDKFVFRLSDKE